MSGQAIALAVDLLAGPSAPRTCRCLCVWCAMEVDPNGEMPTRRAPADSECWRCGDPRRERDGFVFLAVPRGSP